MDRYTLVELAKRIKDNRVLQIAEVLNRVNSILDDAVWIQANGITSHTTTRRTGLPSGSWRRINKGVAQQASQTQQIVEPIGMLEAISQVDEAIIELASDKPATRFQEDAAFLEGLSQTLATSIIYGSGTEEGMVGLANRYTGLSDDNVWGSSGTGSDLSSIWIVQWGPDRVHMVYPQNSTTVGIGMEDDGRITITDSDGNYYKVYQTHFKLRPGLVIRDPRNVQRICNIETSGSSNIFDPDLVVKALRQMPMNAAGAVIYANKTILSQMDINAMDKTNVQYQADNPFGRPQMAFRGVPVRQVDAIVDTESALT